MTLAKTVNQEQNHIPGVTDEISTTIKDLKDAGLVVPIIPLLSSPGRRL